MRKLFFRVWPHAAILIIVAIFFYPVWLQNKIPLPADFIVGVYYPWLDYKWGGYIAGVPVKNPITTDVVSFMYPMQIHAIDLIKHGILPLWNQLILAGTPLAANFQSAPFSPTNIFYLFLPKILAWTIQIMSQPTLAAVFLYLLLRNFGLNKISSMAGGIFYAFAGFLMIWLQWNGHTLVAAFFPLLILLSKKWLEEGKILWGCLLSISLSLQIFSGYPQIILYEMLAILLLCIYTFNFRRILQLGFFIILGMGLSGIQIIPALELLQHSQRSVEDVLNVSAFLPWQYLITFLAPDYFGNHSTGNFWGEGDYTLVTGFSGVVSVFLAVVAVATKFKNTLVKFTLSLIGLSLLISLPNPISIFLKESGLLGLQAASAHRALVLSNLGIAILAAFGLEALFSSSVNLKQVIRAAYLPLMILFGVGIGTLVSFMQVDNNLSANLQTGLRNLIFPVGVLTICFILVLAAVLFKRISKSLVLLLICLAIFELFRFGWKFTPFSEKEFIYPNTPILDFLQNQEKPFRVTAEDAIPINMLMSYQIETVEGYDAVYPLNYAKFLAVLNSGSVESTPMGRYGSVTNYSTNLLNLVNGKYILALKRDDQRTPDENGSVPDKFLNFKKVFEDKTVVVLENPSVYPRAFFVSDWITSSDDEVLNNLISNNFPLDKKIILHQEFNEFTPSQSNSQTKYLKYGLDSLIQVETDKPGFLFISDSYYPGWKATVNGKNETILRADYTFRAIPIREVGVHTVRMYYDPVSFKLGLAVSLISLVILCMIGIIFKYVRKFTQP